MFHFDAVECDGQCDFAGRCLKGHIKSGAHIFGQRQGALVRERKVHEWQHNESMNKKAFE